MEPTPLPSLVIRRYETFDELRTLLRDCTDRVRLNAIIHSAAVSDYLPEVPGRGKLDSEAEVLELRLVRAPKLARELRLAAPGALLITFKLEVGLTEAELIAKATESAARSGADYVVANDIRRYSEGRHEALVIRGGSVVSRAATNTELAVTLADLLGQPRLRLPRLEQATAHEERIPDEATGTRPPSPG